MLQYSRMDEISEMSRRSIIRTQNTLKTKTRANFNHKTDDQQNKMASAQRERARHTPQLYLKEFSSVWTSAYLCTKSILRNGSSYRLEQVTFQALKTDLKSIFRQGRIWYAIFFFDFCRSWRQMYILGVAKCWNFTLLELNLRTSINYPQLLL